MNLLTNEAVIAALVGAIVTAILGLVFWLVRERTNLFRQVVYWAEFPTHFSQQQFISTDDADEEGVVAGAAWCYAKIKVNSPRTPVRNVMLHYSGEVDEVTFYPKIQKYEILHRGQETDIEIPNIQDGEYLVLARRGACPFANLIHLEELSAESALVKTGSLEPARIKSEGRLSSLSLLISIIAVMVSVLAAYSSYTDFERIKQRVRETNETELNDMLEKWTLPRHEQETNREIPEIQ